MSTATLNRIDTRRLSVQNVYASGREIRSEEILEPVIEEIVRHRREGVPHFYVITHSIFMAITAAFSTLLMLSFANVNTLHPFLLSIGVIGGLGLLVPSFININEWQSKIRMNGESATSN